MSVLPNAQWGLTTMRPQQSVSRVMKDVASPSDVRDLSHFSIWRMGVWIVTLLHCIEMGHRYTVSSCRVYLESGSAVCVHV